MIGGYEEIAGKGVYVHIGENRVLAGNAKLLESATIPVPLVEEPGTAVYLAVNGGYAGYILISD